MNRILLATMCALTFSCSGGDDESPSTDDNAEDNTEEFTGCGSAPGEGTDPVDCEAWLAGSSGGADATGDHPVVGGYMGLSTGGESSTGGAGGADSSTGGADATGGALSTGGMPAAGGTGGEPPEDECWRESVSCGYFHSNHPAEATFRDEKSYRSEVSHLCRVMSDGGIDNTLTTLDLCEYSETCELVGEEEVPQCVSCGENGARTHTHTLDNELIQDSVGCRGRGFNVSNCYAATPAGGKAYVTLDYLIGTANIRLYVTAEGSLDSAVWGSSALSGTIIENADINIEANGLIELDLEIDHTYLDNYNEEHRLQITTHIVDRCPE